MVWVRFPGEKLSPRSNPNTWEFPRFSGSEEEADEEWNGLGDEEQDQKTVTVMCWAAMFGFFLGWIWGLFRTVYLLYVLCINIYIYTLLIYVFLGWVGGWG